ncbi:MAG: T9SS type A sorting domain-containing protein [Candidatus Zixiibacteriota bacterium]|nr:MAG: T9SS type A sorting domain-containing protein [candidate division Zixibacteria bacterium]
MKKIIITLIILGIAVTSSATIINIPADYPTIQQGIDASADGDTVLVQPGMYYENINFNGHNIVLGSLFLTTGDTSYISTTIIDGNSSGTVLTFENGEDSTAVTVGFTIQNGLGYSQIDGAGGGITCKNNSFPTITHNMITGNVAIGSQWADGIGGGVYCSNSNAIIKNNIINGNLASRGMWAFGFGGGIACTDNSNAIICHNSIHGNVADDYGGAIYCGNSAPAIINNTISLNNAQNGGGIVTFYTSYPIITNTIFWGDSASVDGNEIFGDDASWPTINYCDIQDILWPGEGNISIDPLFKYPVNGDFHLMYTFCGDSLDSPCIDAGSPHYADSLLDCSRGLGTTISDMGAYGGGDSAIVGIFDSLSSLPDRYLLLQNFPNPFNNETRISFILVQDAKDIELNIYDIMGRLVRSSYWSYLPAGEHNIIWDSKNNCSKPLTSGIYFCSLSISGEVAAKKLMTLLK